MARPLYAIRTNPVTSTHELFEVGSREKTTIAEFRRFTLALSVASLMNGGLSKEDAVRQVKLAVETYLIEKYGDQFRIRRRKTP